jgi:hypothetical protein
MHRRQTAAFINVDPITLRFTRHTARRQANGGVKIEADGSTPQQVVRFVRSILPKNRNATESTSAGQQIRCYDRLVCFYYTDIKAGDVFEVEGEVFEVRKLLVRNYEIVADVELRENAA